MPEITINTTDLAMRLSREEAVLGSIDAKRPTAWSQYGYPLMLTFAHYLQAYERNGAGHGAVHRILDKCWQTRPRIKKLVEQQDATKAAGPTKDEPTPWEMGVDKMLRKIGAWQKLRDFDRRNMIGRYAGLIYRVADNRLLSEPLTSATKLVDLVPLFENQLRVTRWHDDQRDADTFGTPAMFQYRMRMPTGDDTQAQPDTWVEAHPTRVQVFAEGSVGNMFDGVPLLKAGFNHLVELEKVSGGSAESYLKNSARTVVLNFDANASPQVITQNTDGSPSGKSVSDVVEEKMQRLNKNIDASIVTQGGGATTLQTQQSPPDKAFEVAANLFAAAIRIPHTILFGQQTGRLASDEDQKDMNARCESRQDTELTPMLEQFVQRMQACGLIEAGDFEIEWPPLDAPGDEAKYTHLGKLTAAMQQAQSAGLTEPLFDQNELRRVAGFEPRADDGMPSEGQLQAEQDAQRQHELALRGLPTGGKPAAPPAGAKPQLAKQ